MKLKDKVALISGATSGMGQGIAKLFAAEGASVIVNGRDKERGYQTVNEIKRAGDDSAWITGIALTVDGGMMMSLWAKLRGADLTAY